MSAGYTEEDIRRACREVGIGRGDLVHLHSALFALGPLEGAPAAETPARIYAAIRDVIGEDGTLTVPASFNDYARLGTPYDTLRSPVDPSQGSFSRYVASHPESVRTYCPMAGVAGVGPLAEEICHGWTGSAYGIGSAWWRLHEHDAHLAFLGVRPRDAFSFVMLIQFAYGVPYLYNKLYTVPVYEDGREVPLPITASVRYLDPEYRIGEDGNLFEQRLAATGLPHRVAVGRGSLASFPSARAVFDEGIRLLSENLYGFLAEPPRFVPGRLPTDGGTGPYITDEQRFGTQ